MKKRVYTSLYLWEILYPILFCGAVIALLLMFFFRLEDGSQIPSTDGNILTVQGSNLAELFPVVVLFLLIVLLVVYMGMRVVMFDENGVTYKHLKKEIFIAWEDVQYVKITLNGNDNLGYGSYLVIATDSNPITHADFRASREGFIVLRYRRSALALVKEHYTKDIIRVTKK